MAKIAVLDKNMINMIAAGEVIERPASVVKELLENSIDAGATKIVVRIEDGGRKLISIVDDGTGMDGSDMATAFEPHATSKIANSDDLAAISTMGFRGEALASIAAVSKVEVVSKTADSLNANKISIDCGEKEAVTPCSADQGTTIEVRNIFYKLPARRKFLRTANTEMTHIIEHFTRIALANCHLDMTLIHNDRQLHHLLGNQSLKERIAALLSKAIADDLIETDRQEKGIQIHALLCPPSMARANSKFQYIFLNGRFIRDKFISHAIREAYRGLIEPNKYPILFLFLTMPMTAYDVNVHPTKIEVRFENANLVHSQILAVLREKLLSTNLDAAAKLPGHTSAAIGPTSFDTPDESRKQRIDKAMADFFKEHKPISTSQQRFSFPETVSVGKEYTYSQANAYQDDTAVPNSANILQLHNSYIVTQTDDGFIIVDQHALHERIIYEDLCRKISEGELSSQRLLIPQAFDVSDTDIDAIKTNSELIEKLGIELAPFGPKTMAIHAFPSLLKKVEPTDFVRDLLDMLSDNDMTVDAERLLHEILDMAACKAAVKAGEKLTPSEMSQLLSDKEIVERASNCPHGRPTTIKFSLNDLEKQFKRT